MSGRPQGKSAAWAAVAYVRRHPGRTAREIALAIGVDLREGIQNVHNALNKAVSLGRLDRRRPKHRIPVPFQGGVAMMRPWQYRSAEAPWPAAPPPLRVVPIGPKCGVELQAAALAKLADGGTYEEAAEIAGVAKSTVAKWAVRLDAPRRRRGRLKGETWQQSAPRPRTARMIALHRKGEPNAVIAERVGVRLQSVASAIHRWMPRLYPEARAA